MNSGTFFLLLILGVAWLPQSRAGEQILAPERAFPLTVTAAGDHLDVRFGIAAGHYMYRDRYRVAINRGVDVGELVLPEGRPHDDPQFGPVMIYRDFVVIRVPVQARQAGRYEVSVVAQGCADSGFCYAPFSQRASVVLGATPPR